MSVLASLRWFETTYGYVYDHQLHESINLKLATRLGAAKVRAAGRTYSVVREGRRPARKDRTWKEALARSRELLHRYPNERIVMRAYVDGKMVDSVSFVVLHKKPPVADTPGVEGIDRWVGAVQELADKGLVKGLRWAGTYVCKPDSDHAHAAAADCFATPESMELIRDLAFKYADYFGTKYHILYDVISYPDGNGGRVDKPYRGTYHSHNHQSVKGGIDYGCPYAYDTPWE